MTELTPSTTTQSKDGRWRKLRQNPVTLKELRSRMRGKRAFLILTVYLLLMSAFIILVYAAMTTAAASGPFGPDPQEIGTTIFACIIGVQIFLVLLVGPSFTAGAITIEKEKQTYDLLRTTLLSANALVMGKLLSALSYVLLLIFAAIPVMSIAFLLGGVSSMELIISQIILFVGAFTFAIWGLFCSSAMRSTLSASVTTFAGVLFLIMGFPSLIGLFLAFLSPIINFSTTTTSNYLEAFVQYGAILLAATNLPATLLVSEIFLVEENSIWGFSSSAGSLSFWIPSPWLIYIPLSLLVALILYWLTVRNVRKIASK